MKVVERKYIYKGKIINVRVDRILTPGGLELVREVVEFRGSCAIVPVLEDKIIFVKQYRHPTEEYILEIPAGKLEPGEEVEETAKRELMEEIGYRPLRLVKVGEFYLTPGYSTEKIHIFVADKLEPHKLEPDYGEELETVFIPISEAREMLKRGEFNDAKTCIGLFYFFTEFYRR